MRRKLLLSGALAVSVVLSSCNAPDQKAEDTSTETAMEETKKDDFQWQTEQFADILIQFSKKGKQVGVRSNLPVFIDQVDQLQILAAGNGLFLGLDKVSH